MSCTAHLPQESASVCETLCGDASFTEPRQDSVFDSAGHSEKAFEKDLGETALCQIGEKSYCYEGEAGTQGVGLCQAGEKSCLGSDSWGKCEKQILPKAEICNGKDDDCDNQTDEGALCGVCQACRGGSCQDSFELVTFKEAQPKEGYPGTLGKMIVQGTCFSPMLQLKFQGKTIPLKLESANRISFVLSTRGLVPGTYALDWFWKGRTSKIASTSFRLLTADCTFPPVIDALNPAEGIQGMKIPFSVHGKRFQAGARLFLGGREIPTKRVRSGELKVLPSLDLSNWAVGAFFVWVENPGPCKSNQKTFRVESQDPTPVIHYPKPYAFSLDKSAFLEIFGRYFQKGAKVSLGTHQFATYTYRSSTLLEISFTPSQKGGWKAGKYPLVVENPSGKRSKPYLIDILAN